MGIRINNNIVNQKGNPAWYEDTLAARPTANLQGRMFVDTNTPSSGIYRDTGSTWVQIADPGAGTTGTLQQVTTNGSTTNVGISITTLTPGSVLFSGPGGLISEDNANLFWDDTNNFLGIGPTGGPTALLDIHSASQNIFIQVNATSTNNSQIAFLNGGVGKWRIGNLYNAGANDFIIYDTTNTLSRLTIKNTGQTFIGSTTTSSGLFVVNSSTSDNHYVAIGSNAPSYRLRDVGSGGALNCGLGISTAVNNFIQGSENGNFCFFNSSTTASPILFGIYDAGTGNTQEAVRISAARNLLIGTSTDSGYKLDVNGTGRFSGGLSLNQANGGVLFLQTAGTNNSIFTTTLQIQGSGSSTDLNAYVYGANSFGVWTSGTKQLTIASTGAATFSSSVTANTLLSVNGASSPSTTPSGTFRITNTASGTPTQINMGVIDSSPYAGWIQAQHQTLSGFYYPLLLNPQGGNVGIGTTTDAGYKLDVNGTGRFSSSIAIGNTVTASVLNTVTNKVSIIIGGVQYYLLASTSSV